MNFELGVYTFGNTPRTDRGGYGPTAQAIRDALEAVRVAEEVGLDVFGFGEHHTASMPLSSPTAMVNAAAASTSTIKLGTTVTVLSTDDPSGCSSSSPPQQPSHPGASTWSPAAARHRSRSRSSTSTSATTTCCSPPSSTSSEQERPGWSGPHRGRPLQDTLIVPRPEQPLTIWLGTGGSPSSVARAVELGLPMFLGILGGSPEHWAPYGHAYREAWAQAGHRSDAADVAVATHGFVAEDDRRAKATYLEHELRMFQTGSAEIGRPGLTPHDRAGDLEAGGMVFAGGANEVADRILHLHDLLGHTRQILQMDIGGMPHTTFLKAIELLGTEVAPQIRKELDQR